VWGGKYFEFVFPEDSEDAKIELPLMILSLKVSFQFMQMLQTTKISGRINWKKETGYQFSL
jgi:hypothetical protein